ncbi:hypothetical protein [Arthrobacter sp. SAFR-044]|uniref:hypothetical protein n=1 Tax=Arthrobacter sp. SAFR-044 TaxID=3387278 RepID=UPI003F7C87C2
MTVVVGSIVAAISTISLVTCARADGIFISQARSLACGVLLILHFPLTHFLDGLMLPWLEKVGSVDGDTTASYWATLVLIVAVQLIILPTRREL